MEIKALLRRKDPKITVYNYAVDDVIKISGEEYASLYQDLLSDRSYFEGREGNCYLVLGEGERDGILIELEGYKYARYSALIPYARTIVEEHIRELADYVINKFRTIECCTLKILYEELEGRFGTKITPENGFGKLLAETFRQRGEAESVVLQEDGVSVGHKSEYDYTAEREARNGGTDGVPVSQRYPSLISYARGMEKLVERYAAHAIDSQLDGKSRIRSRDIRVQGIAFDENLFISMLSERAEIAGIECTESCYEITIAEPYVQADTPLKELEESEIEVMLANHILWLNDAGGKQADFSNCILRNIDLQKQKLLDANFDGAKFVNVNLQDTGLCFSSFKGTRFYHCNLIKAVAEESDFSGAKLYGTELYSAVFTHSNFTGVRLVDCSGTGMSLQNCCVENMDAGNLDLKNVCMNNICGSEKEWLTKTDDPAMITWR